MQIQITVNAPELVGAINNLAAAMGGNAAAVTHITAPASPAALVSAPQPPAYQPPAAPQQNVLHFPPQQPAVPVAPAYQVADPGKQPGPAQPPAAVPTAAPVYTLDQLAVAATSLMDAGHDIVPLLGQFGIQALTQLPKEQYGAFATSLRGLGAKI